MEPLVIPWLRYGLLSLAVVSLFLFVFLLWVLRQGVSQPETKWLSAITGAYGLVAVLALDFVSISHLEQYYWNSYLRLSITHLGFILSVFFYLEFFNGWNALFYKIMGGVITLPWLYMIGVGPLESQLELTRTILPWGETITVMKAQYHPLVVVRNLGSVLMMLVSVGRCLWLIYKKDQIQRHVLLAIALVIPILVGYLATVLMPSYTIPVAQFGFVGFVVVMVVPVLQEVTASRTLSQALIEREAQMRFMASQVPGVLYSMQIYPGGQRNLLFLSERSEEILGIPSDSPEAFPLFLQGISPEEVKRFLQDETKALQKMESWHYVAPYKRPDGRNLWFKLFSHISPNDSGLQSNGVIFDITASMRQEQELKALLNELTLRKDELEGLLFSLSHDLRRPLVTINGFASESLELVEAATDWNGESKHECLKYLRLMREECQRMSVLIATLVDIGRKSRDNLNIKNVDLAPMVNELIKELPFAQNGMSVEVNLVATQCKGDAQHLKLALTKVLDNAIDYRSPTGGCKIRISSRKEEGRVRLFVWDNGIGFDNRYAETIFQAFQQLHPSQDHQGIGLTFARLALLRMDGRISIHSEPKQGTMVTLDLPDREPEESELI